MSTENLPESWFIVHIGGEIEEMRPGCCRVALRIERHHTNPQGVAHGGVLASLMDTAIGYAIACQRQAMGEEPLGHVTIEMNVSYLSPLRPGDEVVVEGRLLRLGKRLAVGEAEARRRGGDLAAKGRLTFAMLDQAR